MKFCEQTDTQADKQTDQRTDLKQYPPPPQIIRSGGGEHNYDNASKKKWCLQNFRLYGRVWHNYCNIKTGKRRERLEDNSWQENRYLSTL